MHIKPNAVYNAYTMHAYNPAVPTVKGEAEAGEHSEAYSERGGRGRRTLRSQSHVFSDKVKGVN